MADVAQIFTAMEARKSFATELDTVLNSARLCGDSDVLVKSTDLSREIIADLSQMSFGVPLRDVSYNAMGDLSDRSFHAGAQLGHLAFDTVNNVGLREPDEQLAQVVDALERARGKLGQFVQDNPAIRTNWSKESAALFERTGRLA